ncbi:hypothetical protein CXG45_21780 [Pseudomonas plecoglossicida]|uniref:Uncharacterized protein n=1 Tax=Pseudomonas plecoglossicida TaxID=70775 RepID=A0ABX4U884_PSEDL|nr:hypothetical protein CXG44_23150 [Pseudomonas plecoglossicida]PLU90894.1 hypothetical protein CXG45_21780 [Pseudomonas plecoglossicida]PLV01429.1 hypothetical protein CXG48_20270 [Pseudomonas plecoglossicida]PLV16584.1 hypothetical protein CXG47_00055 [Pseudomonas plecoglossicida]
MTLKVSIHAWKYLSWQAFLQRRYALGQHLAWKLEQLSSTTFAKLLVENDELCIGQMILKLLIILFVFKRPVGVVAKERSQDFLEFRMPHFNSCREQFRFNMSSSMGENVGHLMILNRCLYCWSLSLSQDS